MADSLIAPIGEPVVLGPARSGATSSSCKDIIPWTSSSGSPKTERYYLHPLAAREEFQALPDSVMDFADSQSSSTGPFRSSSSTSVPLLQLLGDDNVNDHRPVLAWQDSKADYELDIAFPHDSPSEEQLVPSDGHQWIVVFVCGIGKLSVGRQMVHQPSDVWTCFGNVMLARRGQQIMLCRCAAYPQMINVQCASNGRDVVIHDCRCSSEDWYMHLSHEQVCMDSLSGFLLFMLTAASQVLAQFGMGECTSSAASSSIPPWQTSCSQTNQWVSQSGSMMWDVVFNGKSFAESRCEGGSCPIGNASSSYSGTSSDDASMNMSALCDGDKRGQPTRSSDALRVRVPVQLALMDSEPDAESAVIEDIGVTSGAGKMPLALCDRRTEELVSETRPEFPQQGLAENPKPAETHISLNAELGAAEPAIAPKKPTSKRTHSRPRPQPGSTTRAQENQFQCFRMDAGEKPATRKRESSLARQYDALDADAWNQINETSTMHGRDVLSSMRALAGCKAPAELPPVKGKSSKQAASRFYARHRATMEAASAMAWEADQCDADSVNTCMRPSSTAKQPNDLEFRSSSRKLFSVSPASAMAIDLDAGISEDKSTTNFSATHYLRPFVISSAKLPSLPPQKSSKASAWSVPMTSPFNVF